MKQEIKESSQNQAATAGQNVLTETHATKTENLTDHAPQAGGVSSPVLCSGFVDALEKQLTAIAPDGYRGLEFHGKSGRIYISREQWNLIRPYLQAWDRRQPLTEEPPILI